MANTSVRKRILLLCFLSLSIFSYAQTNRYHTVKVGETLASISKLYDISEEEIRNANPNASKVFYIGLRLIIPESKVVEKIYSEPLMSADEKKRESKIVDKTESEQGKINSEIMMPNTTLPVQNEDAISLTVKPSTKEQGSTFVAGVSAGTDFSEIVGINYGFYILNYLDTGLSPYFSIATNILSESKSDADVIVKVGVSYRYLFPNQFFAGATLCYSLTGAKHNSRFAAISGADFMPYIGYSFGRLELSVICDSYVSLR